MELVGRDMVRRWKMFIGPSNCQVAKVKAPETLRAIFGKEGVRNAVYGSDSLE